MKRKNVLRYLIVLLLIILGYESYSFGNILLNKNNYIYHDIKKAASLKDNKTFAIMIEEEDGSYKEAENRNEWPDSEFYVLLKSECKNELGDILDEVTSYDTIQFDESDNTIKVETSNTIYCTLYFGTKTAEHILLSRTSPKYLKKASESDELTRYIGNKDEITNNYICFGTNDTDKCKNDSEKYMYRIIGVTNENVNEKLGLVPGQLKIIRAYPSNFYLQWYQTASYVSSVSWEDSDIQNYLNAFFYTIDSEWQKIIGEQDKNGVPQAPKWYIGETKDITQEGTKTISSPHKLGLMYVSDYSSTYYNLNNGRPWLELVYGIPSSESISGEWPDEWTMSKYGYSTTNNENIYTAWSGGNVGSSSYEGYNNAKAVRPVFYLTSKIKLLGEGTFENPYTIPLVSQSEIKEIKITNDSGTSINVEINAESNREIIEYCYKLNNQSEFTCTSSNIHIFNGLDNNLGYGLEIYLKNSDDTTSKIYKKVLRAMDPLEALKFTGEDVFAGGGNHTVDINGLYRYTGFNTQVLNNYICFETDNPDTCKANKDKYMYRIIGITSTDNSNLELSKGQLKVIKSTPLEYKIKWNDRNSKSAVVWQNSFIERELNSTSFLDKIATVWQDKISSPKWHNGLYGYTDYTSGTKTEQDVFTTVNYKIGLMYASDYYNANNGLQDINNWLNIYNGTLEKNKYYSSQRTDFTEVKEWTMTSTGQLSRNDESRTWFVPWNGKLSYIGIDDTLYARPVFYVIPEIKLQGAGTEDDPFIILDAN